MNISSRKILYKQVALDVYFKHYGSKKINRDSIIILDVKHIDSSIITLVEDELHIISSILKDRIIYEQGGSIN